MDIITNDIISKTSQYVAAALKENDASHDFAHIQRVHALAQHIAKQENCSADDLELVSLAALMHDIADYKYSGSETAGAEVARSFLKRWNIQRNVLNEFVGLYKEYPFTMKWGGQRMKLMQ